MMFFRFMVRCLSTFLVVIVAMVFGCLGDSLAIASDKYGYIDKSGNVVAWGQFDSAWIFSEELAEVKKGGKYGFINKNGNLIIPTQFTFVGVFSEGLARVKTNEKFGFIDSSGNMVIPARFELAWDFSEGLARFEKSNKQGFIDKNGTVIIPPQFDSADSFKDGLARIKTNNRWGYCDKNGNIVIAAQYDDFPGDFCEGLARVTVKGKDGFIDKSGKIVIPIQFDSAGYYSDGLARVKSNGKFGYIDKSGRIVIPAQFEDSWFFSEGLAAVKTNGKWGYIDKSGKFIIPLQFWDHAKSFSEGLAAVKSNGKWGYIDKSGKFIIPVQFDETWGFGNGMALVKVFDSSPTKESFTFGNGDRYEGDIVNGKFQGKGIYTFKDGRRYEGDFVDNNFHGVGVFFWPDGDRYEGIYMNDKRNGKGVYIWSDGDRYDGTWVDGKSKGFDDYYNQRLLNKFKALGEKAEEIGRRSDIEVASQFSVDDKVLVIKWHSSWRNVDYGYSGTILSVDPPYVTLKVTDFYNVQSNVEAGPATGGETLYLKDIGKVISINASHITNFGTITKSQQQSTASGVRPDRIDYDRVRSSNNYTYYDLYANGNKIGYVQCEWKGSMDNGRGGYYIGIVSNRSDKNVLYYTYYYGGNLSYDAKNGSGGHVQCSSLEEAVRAAVADCNNW